MIIKNIEALTSHGNVNGRKTVLTILEAGLEASDPYENTKRLIRVQGGKLIVGHKDFIGRYKPKEDMPLVFDLSKVGNIYLVGGGKAAQRMAHAIEDVLGDLIVDGQLNAKKGEPRLLRRVPLTFAGHPLPDEDSVAGARRIMEIEQKARKGDLVFFVQSGGASALTTLPGPGLSLQDIQDVTRMLFFERGASMPELNSVRGILAVLTGRHERYIGDATMIEIDTDEIPPWTPLDSIHRKRSSTVYTSEGSYQRAIETLKRYDLWSEVPQSVRTYLENADPRYDITRPAEREAKPRYYFRVFGPEYMLEGTKKKAEQMGVNAYIFASSLNDIEASAMAEMLAFAAREVETRGQPFKAPCAIIFGGEPTVTVGGATGKGGRNQEFALSTAPRIEGSKNIAVAAADSDGSDGPTIAAGGIVDGYTMDRAKELGIDAYGELSNHNSHGVLTRLGDAIITGVRSTNVRGLGIVYIEKTSS